MLIDIWNCFDYPPIMAPKTDQLHYGYLNRRLEIHASMLLQAVIEGDRLIPAIIKPRCLMLTIRHTNLS